MSIYFDYNASTPLDPRVLELMLPYLRNQFGNPASEHPMGWEARKAVEEARNQIAQLLTCDPHEILFTSGATESNNTVLHGIYDNHSLSSHKGEPIQYISSTYEHNSVARSLDHLEDLGVQIVRIAPNKQGLISADSVLRAITNHTKLVSLIWTHNELGSINPILEIAEKLKNSSVLLHSDGTQAVGRFPISLKDSGIDFMSFSGHKIYGPKGIGALYVAANAKTRGNWNPYIWGGGQERGLRSGTLNVPGIVGMGAACSLIKTEMPLEIERLIQLRNELWKQLQGAFPEAILNGPDLQTQSALHSPNTLNITFQSYSVPLSFKTLCVSRGSACHAGDMGASESLKSIGVSDRDAQSTLRISLGRDSQPEHILFLVEEFKKLLKKRESRTAL